MATDCYPLVTHLVDDYTANVEGHTGHQRLRRDIIEQSGYVAEIGNQIYIFETVSKNKNRLCR